MQQTDWKNASAGDLIDALTRCGRELPPGLAREIHRRAGECLDALVALVTDPARWVETDGPEGRAPLHAMALLGAIGDPRGAPALVWAVRTQELGDWLTEYMSGIMGWLEPAAIDTLVEAARDRSLDCSQRNAPSTALCIIACRHPEARGAVGEQVRSLLRDEDPTFVAMMARSAAHLGDPSIQAAIDEAFSRGAVDLGFVRPDGIERRRLEGPWSMDRHWIAPWKHLDREVMRHVEEHQAEHAEIVAETGRIHAEIQRKQEHIDQLQHETEDLRSLIAAVKEAGGAERDGVRAPPKVGRNDPCPCGSGRKYKKCHGG